MPELPEVFTISQDLKKNIVGFEIRSIQFSSYYRVPDDIKKSLNKLIGKKILDVDRVAKNIVLKLSKDDYIIFHLAMTGRLLLRNCRDKNDNWVKLVLIICKGDEIKELRFCDMRQFGKVLVVNKENLNKIISKYGLSALEEKTSAEDLLYNLKSRRTNIKNALMDQKIISGLGNIYATEALFLSKINPKLPTRNFTLEMSTKLLNSIRQELKEAIKNRGATLPDKMYVDIFGKPGHQQDYFKIYLKKVCDVCGSKVEFEKINGRGTYFCPICQPLETTTSNRNKKIPDGQKKLL